jgi:photosystem II stability/assembly factor-like uncharacterized protein
MKIVIIHIAFFLFLSCSTSAQIFNYNLPDSSAYIQYRRGIALQPGYQTYEQKYPGKNLNEEKRRLFPLQSTGVWTELSPGVPRVTYIGVHFVNPDLGWAVGDLGALIKTTNGGDDWTISETQTTTLLLRVHSYDGQIVIATGYDGLILRSTDGGETFQQIASGTTNDLWGVQMLNDTLGFVCGLNQTLLQTTDSGLNWQSVSTGLNSHYWALDFLDDQYGMIACGGGKVIRTTDGGNSWTQIQAGDASDLYAIDIIDSLHIAAAGYLGKNVYSSDGGTSWVQNAALQHNELNSIKFIDTDTGYTIGTYQGESWGIRKTTNRGQNWFNPPVGNLSEWELELLPGGVGYSVGSNLMINKTTGGYDNWGGLFLNTNFVDVHFTDEMTGYAADGRYTGGPVYKTTDGGYNWFGLPNFPRNVFTSTLRCVTFTDSVTGYAGSAPCRIVKTTDAGDSWYVVNRTGLTDTIGLINRIFFINPITGWAVTTRGGILKTTDSGENWFAQLNAGINIIFSGVYFVDTLYGWISGGRPYKTTDGGINWIQQTNTTIWNSDDVYFQNIDTGWFGKYSSFNNSLFKTTNGGISWNPIPEVIGARKFYFFPDPIHWLIIGFARYYITNNFGNNWSEFTENVPTGIVSFSAPTNNLGFFVGNLGLILRYDDTTYVPVELISFSGFYENEKIILNWKTASEINNRGFEIERSIEKTDWEIIGFIEGNGTTAEINNYIFTDNLFENNSQYLFYRLKQLDFDGSFDYSKVVEVEVGKQHEFYLSQNYPNPFNPETNIDYNISVETLVNISLYDITGRKIKELVNEKKQPGYYTLELKGGELSSGIYFYRLTTNSGYTTVKKLTIIK